RPRDLPDLLHAERPDLRVLALQAETLHRDSGEMALRSLRQYGHARVNIGPRLEVAELLARATAAAVAGADTTDARVRDEELRRGRLGQDRRARLLRLRAQPAAELRKGGDVVAVVTHRRRRRNRERPPRRQEVDRLVLDAAEEWHLGGAH